MSLILSNNIVVKTAINLMSLDYLISVLLILKIKYKLGLTASELSHDVSSSQLTDIARPTLAELWLLPTRRTFYQGIYLHSYHQLEGICESLVCV